MTTTEELVALAKELDAAATPGPWVWRGNVDSQALRLSTESGPWRYTVMDFARWGMQNAAPRFREDGVMVRADERVMFEVNHTATKRTDRGVYRGDIIDVRHTDARFIACSRTIVSALLERITQLEERIAEMASTESYLGQTGEV